MHKNYTCWFIVAFICIIIFPVVYVSRLQVSNSTSLQQMEYTERFEVSGVIEPDANVMVSLAYPAYIKNVYVKKDNYVNKGQLIFSLDKEKMENAVKESYSTDKKGIENAAKLAFTPEESENIYEIPSEICASDDGIISSINVYEGSLALSGNILCTISKNDKTVLKLTVNQEDYSRINVGDSLKISPTIAQERVYDAVIIDRCAMIRKENTAFGVKTVIDVFAQIANPDDFIIQGVQFSGHIIKEPRKEVDFLPYEYIHQDENGEYVSVFKDGGAEKVYILTGEEFENGIEILTKFKDNAIFLQEEKLKKDKILLLK